MYEELTIATESESEAEIILAELSDLPFDSFTTDETSLRAYAKVVQLSKSLRKDLNDQYLYRTSWRQIKEENWNILWEKNFTPVMIEDKICVRAPFHEPSTAREEIIVSPKMAFGTAHPATTYMMLNAMHSLELANSSVLDIGCGTGILGIYAANRNSIEVGAYDFDEWSVANTIENAGLNSVDKLEVWLGDVDSIPKRTYDYILANINLNTLRDQLESYLKHLNPNGLILMSGVLATDRKALQELAQALNLKLVSEQTRENWLQQTYGWN